MSEANEQAQSIRRWKSIAVFISSTFRDMHAERDALNRWVFPALDERLKGRRFRLEPIDLRIGVEASEADSERLREQQILKVCLQEIDRSRPFLLVLLGDRYGWVPEEERIRAAAEEVGFVTKTSGLSVTSLEIEYGLLRKYQEQRQRSILFLRNPLPYAEMGERAAEFSEYYSQEAGAASRATHLSALKKKLEGDELLAPHLHKYNLEWDKVTGRFTETSMKAWAEQAIEALWQQLDEETVDFVPESNCTWQEQDRFNLEEFIERLDRGFVGRKALVNEAVEFLLGDDGDTNSWCITAESGAGKSAFFARVYERILEQLAQTPRQNRPILLVESGGISPRAGRLYWLLRRWTGELAAEVGVKADLPDELKVQELEERFAEMLSDVCQQRRVLLMADALDQFERSERAQAMSWLPENLPDNMRLLATAIPGAESERIAKRGGRLLRLPPFTSAEIEDVARAVYGHYHRMPSKDVIAQLAATRRDDGAEAAANALWLSLALELLNLVDADDFAEAERDGRGSPEEKLRNLVLTNCRMLPANTEGLYSLFLDQVEKATGRVESRCFTSLIALSRSGWREEDLQPLLSEAADVLFPDQSPPSWDPLKFAIFRRFFRTHLLTHGENKQIDFAHPSLRLAIRKLLAGAWKPSDADPISALHARIADQLQTTLADSPSRSEEMMWQVLGTRDLSRFAHYYVDPDARSGQLAEYLAEESHTHSQEMLGLAVSSLEFHELSEKEKAVVGRKLIGDLGGELQARDEWALQRLVLVSAEKSYLQLCEQNPMNEEFVHGLCGVYAFMGNLYHDQGQCALAIDSMNRAASTIAEYAETNAPTPNLAIALTAIGIKLSELYSEIGNPQMAQSSNVAIAELVEQLQQEHSDYTSGLLACYYNHSGALLERMDSLSQGMDMYRKAQSILERLSVENPQSDEYAHNLLVSYHNIGDALRTSKNYSDAIEFYTKANEIAIRLKASSPQLAVRGEDLSSSYDRLCESYLSLNDLVSAFYYAKKSLAIKEELRTRNLESVDYAIGLIVSYNSMGDLNLFHLDHKDDAITFYRKAAELAEWCYERDNDSPRYSAVLIASWVKMWLFFQETQASCSQEWYGKVRRITHRIIQSGNFMPSDKRKVLALKALIDRAPSEYEDLQIHTDADASARSNPVDLPSPHPRADGDQAAKMNMEYQKALRDWRSLPWIRRLRTPKPMPPTGI